MKIGIPGLAVLLSFAIATLSLGDEEALRRCLTFHAGFDDGPNAGFARGDGAIYTADAERQNLVKGLHTEDVSLVSGRGKFGAALEFRRPSESIVLFRTADNLPYQRRNWSGSVSLWLSLDPDRDLQPGFADPIQITDKTWNNASFFVDFTRDDRPRKFRLGVFADYPVWNPNDTDWETLPVKERPMATVDRPPFARGKWTHVAFTFSRFNSDSETAVAALYVDGKRAGEISRRRQTFTWNPDEAAAMLGLSYVGLLDELAFFNRELTEAEIVEIYRLPRGVAGLYR